MANVTSPSPIIDAFVNAVVREFPEGEKSKIAQHQDAIAETTSEGDPHRARICVKWAIKMADDKNQKHPLWEQLKERHQIWKDEWFAFDFGVADAMPYSGSKGVVGRAEPIEDVRIEWVENAVVVAKRLGEDDGWENSPSELSAASSLVSIINPRSTRSTLFAGWDPHVALTGALTR
jgi:hypothetical protein